MTDQKKDMYALLEKMACRLKADSATRQQTIETLLARARGEAKP